MLLQLTQYSRYPYMELNPKYISTTLKNPTVRLTSPCTCTLDLPVGCRTAPPAPGHDLDGLPHLHLQLAAGPVVGEGPDAGLLGAVALELNLLVEGVVLAGAGLALLDHPAGGAELAVQLLDGGQLDVDLGGPAAGVGALLDVEGGDGQLGVVVALARREVVIALVEGARDPGGLGVTTGLFRWGRIAVGGGAVGAVGGSSSVDFLADQAVRQREGALVGTHLLRGVVPAPDAEQGQLGVAALYGGRDAVGGLVGAGKVRGVDDGLPGGLRPAAAEALEVLAGGLLGPHDGPLLPTVQLDLHVVRGGVRVGELLELGRDGRRPHRLGPLVEEGVDERAHLGLERRADAQLVLEHHLLQVLEPAGQLLEPARRALQLVGRADVEHEVAVQDGDHLGRRHILSQELRVLGLGAAVARDKDVEALVCCDESEAGEEFSVSL